MAYYIPAKSGTTVYTRITTFLTICSGPAIYHWHRAAGYSTSSVKNRVYYHIKFALNWKVWKTKQSNRAVSEHKDSVCLRGLDKHSSRRRWKVFGLKFSIEMSWVEVRMSEAIYVVLPAPPRPFPVKMTRDKSWMTSLSFKSCVLISPGLPHNRTSS
jgi:hypothetical protein